MKKVKLGPEDLCEISRDSRRLKLLRRTCDGLNWNSAEIPSVMVGSESDSGEL